jgi:6-phosphogluconate dehydrogenase
MELYKQAEQQGVQIVDVGTSGGIWGEDNGFSMMVGGDGPTVERLTPLFDELAKPSGAWHHFGPTGTGHFVKMVHNGIEYGLMQAYAEGYRLIKEGPFDGVDLGKVAEVWQHGSINQSFLNGLIEHMLKENPELAGVEGKVAESGEARWMLETAQELGIPTPVIQQALDVRLASQNGETNFATKLLAQLRNEFGGHHVNPDEK